MKTFVNVLPLSDNWMPSDSVQSMQSLLPSRRPCYASSWLALKGRTLSPSPRQNSPTSTLTGLASSPDSSQTPLPALHGISGPPVRYFLERTQALGEAPPAQGAMGF